MAAWPHGRMAGPVQLPPNGAAVTHGMWVKRDLMGGRARHLWAC